MKKWLVLSLLGLTACATPEQEAAWRQMQLQKDYNNCVNYGLRPGTEAFANCRMQLDLQRQRPVYYSDPYPYSYYYGPSVGFSYSRWHR